MSKVYTSAVKLLARREHGYFELLEKLIKNGYSETDSHDALAKLRSLDLQSDERFVEMLCRTRINQGYGPQKIAQELKAKHIATDLIEAKLAAESENWVSYAIDVWLKKYKQQSNFSYLEKQKQKNFLFYRGFSMETIAMVFEYLT